mmetsp:Transcript_1866/g.4941  ORF Transcript_1866/g.4941 Transcript_1866/m.4941 type:complete len:231 (+) Transcript_1866:747-1439(+)
MHTQPLAHPSPFPSPLSPRPSPPPSPTPTPSPGPPPSPPPSLPPTPSPSPTPTPSPFPPPLPPSHTMLWPRPAQVHACARRDSAPPCCQCLRQLLNAVVWRGCSKRYACVEWHVFRCLFSSYGRFNLVQSGVGTRVTARVGLALFFPYLFSWDVRHTNVIVCRSWLRRAAYTELLAAERGQVLRGTADGARRHARLRNLAWLRAPWALRRAAPRGRRGDGSPSPATLPFA